MSDELVIVSYQCPLCGDEVNARSNGGLYLERLEHGAWYLYDRTPCCAAWLAWLQIEGVLIYLGTFRNGDQLRLWVASCGSRQNARLVGEGWNAEKGQYEYEFEIPF